MVSDCAYSVGLNTNHFNWMPTQSQFANSEEGSSLSRSFSLPGNNYNHTLDPRLFTPVQWSKRGLPEKSWCL